MVALHYLHITLEFYMMLTFFSMFCQQYNVGGYKDRYFGGQQYSSVSKGAHHQAWQYIPLLSIFPSTLFTVCVLAGFVSI